MPRPNQPRSIASEQALARRIAHEREKRGWSYEGMASRMTMAGCAINASAIYKIEKADPPRRITVDELVGLANVFGLPIPELLLPPEIAAKKEIVDLITAWDRRRGATVLAQAEEAEAWKALTDYANSHPESEESLTSAMEAWVDFYVADEQRPGAHSYWMWKITQSDEWAKRAAEDFQAEVGKSDG